MDWTMVVAIAESASAIIAAAAIFYAVALHKKQMLLEQRQLLLPLWGYLQDLDSIDPNKPVWKDVIKGVNLLELMAVCCEGQLIDPSVIRRMYSSLYIKIYQAIQDCKDSPANVGKDGKQMLLDCPAAIKLYDELMAEHAARGQLKPIN